MQTVQHVRPRTLWRSMAIVIPLLALFMLPRAAMAWENEEAMRDSTNEAWRDSFIYPPAPGTEIPRQAFVRPPLESYYEKEGFDRNFLTWAPTEKFEPGTSEWSSCLELPHPGEPCPADLRTAGYVKVTYAVKKGSITAVRWGQAFIGTVCGNFTPFGAAGPVPTISGVKYEDVNGNGRRDPEDKGLPGWEMQLLYEGNVVATTKTAADGSYSFALNTYQLSVGEGTYQVKEVQQPGWHASQAPSSFFVKLGVGQHDFGGNDFGNYRLATISGHKYDDTNVNGVWDTGEKGLAEWTMQLSNGESRTTGSEGDFSFEVPPGAYTLGELLQGGWRQTDPGGVGTRTYTVTSGQVVSGADFGNVCLGGVSVQPIDDSTGLPLSGMEVRLEEVSVPGILHNEPALPRSTSEEPSFEELLPGAYRIVAFLPEGVFTTDPNAVAVEGRFAIVKDVSVSECKTAKLALHLFLASTTGKVTGGVDIAVPGGDATSGFVFMNGPDTGLRGELQYNDHETGLDLHTSDVEALHVEGDSAIVWGKVGVEGNEQRFLLRLLDAGEPGTDDRYELSVANGYMAGQGETLSGGNVQLHS